MIIIYILLLLLSVLPLWKTIRYIRLEERIRKEGISTSGVVVQIRTVRYQRGPANDRVQVRFGSIIIGEYHVADFLAKHGKYRSGDTVAVKYLPEKPDKIVVAGKRGYWLMLVFSVIIVLFVCFAVYKIDEMVKGSGEAGEGSIPAVHFQSSGRASQLDPICAGRWISQNKKDKSV